MNAPHTRFSRDCRCIPFWNCRIRIIYDQTRDNARFGRARTRWFVLYLWFTAARPASPSSSLGSGIIRPDKTVFEEPERRVPVTPVSGNDLSVTPVASDQRVLRLQNTSTRFISGTTQMFASSRAPVILFWWENIALPARALVKYSSHNDVNKILRLTRVRWAIMLQ